MNQHTLKRIYSFEGKGLHTGVYTHMAVCPAPAGTGIRFVRRDIGESYLPALANHVSNTARSTTISNGQNNLATIEHLMSALTGLGVDNAIVEVDNIEVPILDGSALPYVQAIAADGLLKQYEERKWLEISEPIEVKNENGSYIRITPADHLSIDLVADFNSKVLGLQKIHFECSTNYAQEIAPCRTFCFFHELEYLAEHGLVKGGDMDNAIVVVEYDVTPEQVKKLSKIFGQPELCVNSNGYLNNLKLRFPDECGRHKMLDFIGDMRLCGGYLKARIEAYKPGHSINTKAAKAVIEKLK